MFSKDEKKLLKELVEKEIEEVSDEASTIVEKFLVFSTGEMSYEEFLKKLLEKLE